MMTAWESPKTRCVGSAKTGVNHRVFESPLVHQILKNLTDFSEFQNLARLAIWSLRAHP
jgi:hypothetical protein